MSDYSDLSYRTPVPRLIRMLRQMGSCGDLRVLVNQDITRALLHNAADRLKLISENIDPRPWRTRRQRLSDAWDVYRQRAVALRVKGSVFDHPKGQDK